MAKLTLNVDEGVVSRAKRYAARRGTSVSRLSTDTLAEPVPASYPSGRKHLRRAVPGGSRRAVTAAR
jgi:hypothetical protein